MDAFPVRYNKDEYQIHLIEDLIPFLQQASVTCLTRWECETILRNLIVFASETPTEFIKNLFEEDQVKDVSSYNLYSFYARNWQWVLLPHALSSSDCMLSFPGESHQDRAWIKSRSVLLGRFMSTSNIAGSARVDDGGGVRLIIGFWLKKLYEAKPGIVLHEIPECVDSAYHGFLEWKGDHWKQKKIPTIVLKTLYSCKLTDRLTPGITISRDRVFPVKLRSSVNDSSCKQVRAEFVRRYCEEVGTKRLLFYLMEGFSGTLEEYSIWCFEDKGIQEPKKIVKIFEKKIADREPGLRKISQASRKQMKVVKRIQKKKDGQQEKMLFLKTIQQQYALPENKVAVQTIQNIAGFSALSIK